MLTPDEVKALQQSWARVAPIADAAAQLFYQRLFARDADLARLFTTTDMAVQRRKLVAALDHVVGHADQLDRITPLLAELGLRHRGYGARPEHFGTVGAALLETLAAGLGDAFTADVRAAWTKAYGVITGVMLARPAPPAAAA